MAGGGGHAYGLYVCLSWTLLLYTLCRDLHDSRVPTWGTIAFLPPLTTIVSSLHSEIGTTWRLLKGHILNVNVWHFIKMPTCMTSGEYQQWATWRDSMAMVASVLLTFEDWGALATHYHIPPPPPRAQEPPCARTAPWFHGRILAPHFFTTVLGFSWFWWMHDSYSGVQDNISCVLLRVPPSGGTL